MYAPPADAALHTHHQSILHNALPQLTAPPVSLGNALAQMATALVVQTNDSRAACKQKAAQDNDPKLPSARFTVTLPVLVEYLQVDNELNLPQNWQCWANCSKCQEVQVLRNTLDAFAWSAEAFSTSHHCQIDTRPFSFQLYWSVCR